MSSSPRKRVVADEDTRKDRMALCQACPHAGGGQYKKLICTKCGCVLAAKVMLGGAQCPVGKW